LNWNFKKICFDFHFVQLHRCPQTVNVDHRSLFLPRILKILKVQSIWSGAYLEGLTLPKDLRQRGTFGGPYKKKKKRFNLLRKPHIRNIFKDFLCVDSFNEFRIININLNVIE
jgi:hypothetical protein